MDGALGEVRQGLAEGDGAGEYVAGSDLVGDVHQRRHRLNGQDHPLHLGYVRVGQAEVGQQRHDGSSGHSWLRVFAVGAQYNIGGHGEG